MLNVRIESINRWDKELVYKIEFQETGSLQIIDDDAENVQFLESLELIHSWLIAKRIRDMYLVLDLIEDNCKGPDDRGSLLGYLGR